VLSFAPRNNTEHFEVGLLAPIFAVWTAVALVIACIGVIAVASTASPSPAQQSEASLEPLAEWIDRTGSPSVIRGPIVRALGLPGGDLRVKERGFRKDGEQFTHVCSVSPRPALNATIFFASIDEATGDALVWMADRQGQLQKSVSFVNGLATRNSDSRMEGAFMAEKAYFRSKLRDQIYRTGPASPAPTPAYDVTKRVLPAGHRATLLSSEGTLLFLNPWVIPAIGLILAFASQRRPKSR
jgi:hypothetical protein